jgi:integrase
LPSIREAAAWVKPFRRQIALSCGSSWQVRNSRNQIRLEVKGVSSVTLPHPWSEQGAALALPRIQQIRKRYGDGSVMTLAEAAGRTSNAGSRQTIDWEWLIGEFRKFNPNANDTTWSKDFLPVLRNCRNQFKGQPPRNGEALCLRALEQWPQGMPQRRKARQKLVKFLNWAVQRGYLKAVYAPPAFLPEKLNDKRIGYPLSDLQILKLLEALPRGKNHERWRFALQLAAVYGLRPEDLRYLTVKAGQQPGSWELWSNYRKSQGGNKGKRTQPRILQPLLLRDATGATVNWNLLERLKAGEPLPSLGPAGKASHAMKTYLENKPTWIELKQEATQQGETLTYYSFRHRYSKVSHGAGIPVVNIASAMGHTLEVHLQSYARFSPDNTSSLYAAYNAS